jgi:hypothetical protein
MMSSTEKLCRGATSGLCLAKKNWNYGFIKTAINLFHSGNVAKDKLKSNATQTINPACYEMLYDGILPTPCGLYVEPIHIPEPLNQFQFQPLSDDTGQRMVGLRMTYLSFALLPLFDPATRDVPLLTVSKAHRPRYMIVKNAKRTHTLVLTWPRTTSTTVGLVRVRF